MTDFRTGAPITVLYRGDLKGTASLVGLAQARANVRLIVFTGELTYEIEQYCKTLSEWLIKKGFPAIAIHPNLSAFDLEHVVDNPHEVWGWGHKECKAAIQLAGLPLPPR